MPENDPYASSSLAVKARAVLRQHWGFPQFRPMQEEIILSVLEGRDTLALLPTGGGKSLCYQIPALCGEGLCLVISPLIALMKDQVEQLRKRRITAYAITSGMPRAEVVNTLKVVSESNCRFLYVSPERLETALFREYLPALNIRLIAVDEAHCISQWGYDFRPPYLRIAALREELPGVPVIALTASATPGVQKDIQQKLGFPADNTFRQSFDRPNLSYSVFVAPDKVTRILEILTKVPGSSLIYCNSRKRAREFSDLLRLQGLNCDYYHAGLAQEERHQKQERWIHNELHTLVCTNAFGMGIDKPDVRLVIHADLPDCLENYYQEAGRAGRDGLRSYAVLLYQEQELEELMRRADERFPDLQSIRTVYQALMNYLQLPAGSGEGLSFDFEFRDFLRTFSLDAQLSITVIKLLEREGLWMLTESVFLPSQVQFITDKNSLYQFEIEHPELEPLIKALLRNYGGIFDQLTGIQEKKLAFLLKTETGEVIHALKRLNAYGQIAYQPRKEKPQICFLRNRVPTDQLHIDPVQYQQRKASLQQRIDSFRQFITSEAGCRSRQISQYFGDNPQHDCGICDHCLKRKKKNISEDTFHQIVKRIESALSKEALPSGTLIRLLADFPREQVWEVIEYLQAEEKLITDPKTSLLSFH